jgi:di/tricarboxylate transporter
VFAGIIESVVELRRIRGLRAAVDQAFTLEDAHPERCLVEVVVSPRCALLRETLSGGHFRTLYGASVIAVSRRGRRLRGRLGNVRLAASDVLLLETRPSFVQRHRNSRDFLLISSVEDSAPPRHERAWLAWLVLTGLVLTTTLGWLSMLEAAMLGASAMLLGGCCSPAAARQSVDFSVLLAIAAALGLGEALRVTGAAEAMALSLLRLAGANPWLLLVCVYLATSVLTEVVTNNAVAVLMFSIATAAARTAGFEPMPYVIAVMMGASASFATPLGYQTNLMVYGPGGYRFSDYLRIGVPLNIVAGVVTVLVVPLVWPFRL